MSERNARQMTFVVSFGRAKRLDGSPAMTQSDIGSNTNI